MAHTRTPPAPTFSLLLCTLPVPVFCLPPRHCLPLLLPLSSASLAHPCLLFSGCAATRVLSAAWLYRRSKALLHVAAAGWQPGTTWRRWVFKEVHSGLHCLPACTLPCPLPATCPASVARWQPSRTSACCGRLTYSCLLGNATCHGSRGDGSLYRSIHFVHKHHGARGHLPVNIHSGLGGRCRTPTYLHCHTCLPASFHFYACLHHRRARVSPTPASRAA